jgi:hypothetical protein
MARLSVNIGLAEQLAHDIRRGRVLAAQRAAAEILLTRHHEAPCLARWARAVLRCEEVRHYSLLYRVAESRAPLLHR